jgi:subtilisin family serine protease
MRLLGWTAAIFVACTAVSVAAAGTIAPRLQAEMDRQSPGAVFSVIVNMTDQAPVPALNAELIASKATRAERHARVIDALQTAARGQQPLMANLDAGMRSGGILGYTSYWISNLMVVRGTKEAIAELARRPDVDLIEPNFTADLITPVTMNIPRIDQQSGTGDGTRGIGVTPGLRAIRAPEVWYQLGFNGAGRLIGSLDTGVDGNHPALQNRWRGYQGQQPWQECWLDVLGGNTQFPNDGYGHGTHTTGTMCGLGAATQDTIGVSWGAKWIATNAINQGVGGGFDNDVITCFQWFADPDGNVNTVDDVPDVVQNSWRINEGFGNGYTDCDSRWWNVIDGCEAAGVVVTFSAGNEGPGGTTIGSPPDRATTLYNAFAIGAVDATSFGWPYPIANFSSRGPTGCNVPADRKIKPEVVAPGVNVYSSVPGGGYDGTWSGTSMAGPHVAGIVGLMRQANPNLAVDDIKRILMETARDEGPVGEENTYGWGFVDAYNAVIQATVGFGQIDGYVTNGSWNNNPIQGATVKLLEIGNQYDTDAAGYYNGSAPVATYTVEARHPDFRADTVQVALVANQLVSQNFALVDDHGPSIANVSDFKTRSLQAATPIQATITDPSTVAGATFHYRINGNGWIDLPMTPVFGGLYTFSLPVFSVGTQIDYYIGATDGLGNASSSPATAPATFYTLYFTTLLFADDAEQDNNWSLSASGDNATTGRWVRENPVGTVYQDHPCQPEDDHTYGSGVTCFITENGTPGGDPNAKDVDGGCTTLTAPTFNLNGRTRAFISYHRWWAQEISLDDQFQIDGSSDGGSTWVPLERVGPPADETWRKVTIDLGQYLNFTGNMKIRFKACDQIQGGIVEAGIDDFAIETFNPTTSDAGEQATLPLRPVLEQNEPNPFNPVTTIKFTLSNPAQARIEIFDTTGRLVRALTDAPMTSGVHTIVWNGLDDAGRPVESGVYFYRLKAGAFEQSRRMTILK